MANRPNINRNELVAVKRATTGTAQCRPVSNSGTEHASIVVMEIK